MHDARAIANFLLDYADERGRPITNMALLKHIYFAHGWHLAKTGQPLVRNRIEAWQHGPVIRAVYDAFKMHGDQPIATRARKFNVKTGTTSLASEGFTEEVADLLRDIFNYYSTFGAIELSHLTHVADGPWYRVWHRKDGRVALHLEISNEAICAHFKASAKAGLRH